uniref:Sodium/hydrogen exchanger n=1 Tax=Strongyloides venezuelensis TaxID=75913 RepID=A0A0K0FKV3_STRVS
MFNFQWNDVLTPLYISLWLLAIVYAQIGVHKTEKLIPQIPESTLLILLGFGVGYLLKTFFGGVIHMHPDLFFLYLLPPIVLEAGYFLPNKAFFENIGTICMYAVVGTLWNITSICGVLYLFSPYFSMEIPLIDLMIFSTIISAVDPVALLALFQEVKVNQLLYIVTFGESLLNDAVIIVLYHSLSTMAKIGTDYLTTADILKTLISFFSIAGGGILLGIVGAAVSGFSTRMTHSITSTQPLICFLIPYMVYLFSELYHISGILAIVTCSVLMKPYIKGNISDESRITVKYFIKTVSSTCEAIIFAFLGISMLNENHHWDWVFCAVTVTTCLITRFIGTFTLTYLCNKYRKEKICLVDQFIISYGGFRAAICLGLCLIIDQSATNAKHLFLTTSVIEIFFTCFIQAATIKPLVQFLHVKLEESKTKNLVESTFHDVHEDLMAGLEAIAGAHGRHSWRRRMSDFNREYVAPCFTVYNSSRGDRLARTYDEIKEIEQKKLRLYTIKNDSTTDALTRYTNTNEDNK